ncbi:hypothetical protein Tco_1030235 [Tanacetum coccineum]|uniref:Uncharacterized protein n=1 Tax=Tanacetum coccineum TaxID=301880 RepID=A0ABQ5G6A9_9ASTR
MSDYEDSTVTYTAVSSPYEDSSDMGSPGAEGSPMMLEDPHTYVVAIFQALPSPDYVLLRRTSDPDITRFRHWCEDISTTIDYNDKLYQECIWLPSKPVEKVDYSGIYDSEDEVASTDNDMANILASEKVSYGNNSLLEQWTDSYMNCDYDLDPYDGDMYEGQDIPDKI